MKIRENIQLSNFYDYFIFNWQQENEAAEKCGKLPLEWKKDGRLLIKCCPFPITFKKPINLHTGDEIMQIDSIPIGHLKSIDEIYRHIENNKSTKLLIKRKRYNSINYLTNPSNQQQIVWYDIMNERILTMSPEEYIVLDDMNDVENAQKDFELRQRLFHIKLFLTNYENGYGFRIRGGAEMKCGIYVSKVREGSIAAKNCILPGDRIILINGELVDGCSYKTIVDVLRRETNLELIIKKAGTIPLCQDIVVNVNSHHDIGSANEIQRNFRASCSSNDLRSLPDEMISRHRSRTKSTAKEKKNVSSSIEQNSIEEKYRNYYNRRTTFGKTKLFTFDEFGNEPDVDEHDVGYVEGHPNDRSHFQRSSSPHPRRSQLISQLGNKKIDEINRKYGINVNNLYNGGDDGSGYEENFRPNHEEDDEEEEEEEEEDTSELETRINGIEAIVYHYSIDEQLGNKKNCHERTSPKEVAEKGEYITAIDHLIKNDSNNTDFLTNPPIVTTNNILHPPTISTYVQSPTKTVSSTKITRTASNELLTDVNNVHESQESSDNTYGNNDDKITSTNHQKRREFHSFYNNNNNNKNDMDNDEEEYENKEIDHYPIENHNNRTSIDELSIDTKDRSIYTHRRRISNSADALDQIKSSKSTDHQFTGSTSALDTISDEMHHSHLNDDGSDTDLTITFKHDDSLPGMKNSSKNSFVSNFRGKYTFNRFPKFYKNYTGKKSTSDTTDLDEQTSPARTSYYNFLQNKLNDIPQLNETTKQTLLRQANKYLIQQKIGNLTDKLKKEQLKLNRSNSIKNEENYDKTLLFTLFKPIINEEDFTKYQDAIFTFDETDGNDDRLLLKRPMVSKLTTSLRRLKPRSATTVSSDELKRQQKEEKLRETKQRSQTAISSLLPLKGFTKELTFDINVKKIAPDLGIDLQGGRIMKNGRKLPYPIIIDTIHEGGALFDAINNDDELNERIKEDNLELVEIEHVECYGMSREEAIRGLRAAYFDSASEQLTLTVRLLRELLIMQKNYIQSPKD
ncbi:hypothetical protein SNEBB_005815 [Seison nebaliae]|nr:hypothetical protein SNEBB_005815 [Seison nebaliae]